MPCFVRRLCSSYWRDVDRRFPLRRAIVILAFVQLISMLLDMGIKLIPTQYYAGLALLLPLISSLMLCMSLNRAPDVAASPKANFCLRSEVKQRWRFLATATLFSFIYGLNQVNIGGRWINVVAYGLSGLILLVCCFALRRRMSVHRILNIGFLVVGIGMMACMPLEIEAPSLFSILPSIGFGLSERSVPCSGNRTGAPQIWHTRSVLCGGRKGLQLTRLVLGKMNLRASA